MNALLDPTSARVAAPAPPRDARDVATLWGHGVASLHDLLWRARGLVVVRPGAAPAEGEAGPFLLLSRDALIEFDFRAVVRRPGGAILALTLDEAAAAGEPPVDRLAFGRDGVPRVVRKYRPTRSPSTEPIVVADVRLAQLWASRNGSAGAGRELRKAAGRGAIARRTVAGRRFRNGFPDDADAYVAELMRLGVSPDRLFRDVVPLRPGLFGESDAPVDPRTSTFGPVWLGRGRAIGRDDVLLGPAILWDADDDELADEPPAASWPVRGVAARRDGDDLPPVGGRVYPVVKRGLDLAGALLGLALTLPLYPPILLLIWLEDGRPFFFSHRRETVGGRAFSCHKFRTMRRDAEGMKARLAALNQSDGPQFHMASDPRLTRVGKLLRAVDADEWPQLWNVLVGDMSFVGPRPSPADENRCCPAWREARLSVRPGITGLWQVRRTRQPGLDFQEWIRFDLEYAETIGPRTDARILLDTIALIGGKILAIPRKAARLVRRKLLGRKGGMPS